MVDGSPSRSLGVPIHQREFKISLIDSQKFLSHSTYSLNYFSFKIYLCVLKINCENHIHH